VIQDVLARLRPYRGPIMMGACVLAVAAAGAEVWWINARGETKVVHTGSIEVSSQNKRALRFYPTEAEWATLTVETVAQRELRSAQTTEGKIAVNEDRSTLIFPSYSGRVTKLLAKPGDTIERGQTLFMLEATDAVQGQNDFVSALTSFNKARSQLEFAQITEKRNRDLFEGKASPLKELQQAQAGLLAARNDLRAAETALEAAHNRLRQLGKSDQEIAALQERGTFSAETPVVAPIGGTIVQRKLGAGQYLNSATAEPAYVIGDLSNVWLVAYVRESAAPKVKLGQSINFSVLALPGRMFEAKLDYVAAALEPATRRLMVRATVDNPAGLLKPEMFANVIIFADDGPVVPMVANEAVVRDGDITRVWVALDDGAVELRRITPGRASGRMIHVLEGLQPGERVITRGGLLIDRLTMGS
jgi:membrane fusion protein, heavy metal efflux system